MPDKMQLNTTSEMVHIELCRWWVNLDSEALPTGVIMLFLSKCKEEKPTIVVSAIGLPEQDKDTVAGILADASARLAELLDKNAKVTKERTSSA